jgi:digeranylgeranylglycerophospholipid reductase
MVPPAECQVLVVGAGPAGSRAAAASAADGIETLLIDAKVRIGEHPHCGEFVPRQLFTEEGLNRSCIIQPVERMETFILDFRSRSATVLAHNEMAAPGYLIDRVRFDRDLARTAAAQGATVLSSTRLIGRENDVWIVRVIEKEFEVRAGYVVAADGAGSTVAKLVGMERASVLKGLQVEVPLCKPLDNTFVFLSQDFVGGYGWLFPKDKVANVGLGVLAQRELNVGELLEELLRWLKRNGMIRSGTLARNGGLIPISGVREDVVAGNVLLCGDAAGLTHPITGAGIPQAVFSGDQAGRAAAAAVTRADRTRLEEYENEIRTRYRKIMGHALSKRNLMISAWSRPDFSSTCQQAWISFKGYRKRER